ncbi:restriction endonuclease subunit S [Collinsella sp. TF06-6AC]|uniref:restriction endonuclease subunit S n=1 Tax=Collinsella sp. TF06-6AC TaxID=2292331 RepID=UPI000E44A893|nr:restriction endonuclease subunit S [Collinsella sp. TF06-6AC]RGL43026.1 restriction endonuclease subunit S [Collinsella sp. TF06-6AC]
MVPTPKDGYVRMGVRSHAKGTFLTMVKPGAEIEEKELSRVKAHCLVVNIVFAWEQAIAITSTEDEKALVSHRFPQFLFHDDMHPDYFRYAILNDSFERHLWLASPSGAGRNKTLNVGTMLEYSFTLPNKKEQEAIASCLTRLDSLITLHQRKRRKRLFTHLLVWEQRKLGDCFDFLKNNTLSRADLNGENGIARNVHYGDILIKFGDCLDGEQSDLPFITDDTVLPKFAGSILSEGDVIFADTAEDEAAGKCIELRKLPKEPTISGLHTIPARPRFPFGTGYLGHYLNSDAYHRQLLPLMQGIKVISVSKAALQDTQVRFPSLSEQSAIGVVLSEIDALITLHQ